MAKKTILFVHLLNNFTGSPKVLKSVICCVQNEPDIKVSLLTSKTDGLLSHIDNVQLCNNGYHWTNCKPLLAFLFLFSQIRVFFFVLFHRFDVVYINTVVPFGAALAAKIKKEKIIYHVHEIYLQPDFIKRFYYMVMNLCAGRIICVSNYVKENLPFCCELASVVYNPIEKHDELSDLPAYLKEKFCNKIIFMPTSLKEHKGVKQFVELARKMSDYRFRLLCSVPLEEIRTYFSDIDLPENLTLIGKQTNLFDFYKESSITINLSLPDKWVETFGLTIAEGFDAYAPAIAPDFGGPKEIVTNEVSGFLVNPYDLDSVEKAIRNIMRNFETYEKFARNARLAVEKFSSSVFEEKIISEIKEVSK